MVDMRYSPKQREFRYNDHSLRLCNQCSADWTHPYHAPSSDDGGTLHSSGCGIFALTHLIEYHCGQRIDIEAMADYAMACGGCGDDGTDRPVLLAALQRDGVLARYGLTCPDSALMNDHEALWQVLRSGGKALCDLRPGHIVAPVDTRVADGERQLLVIDSHRDCIHHLVREDIREVIEGTEVLAPYVNARGICTFTGTHYAMFWVPLTKPFDFNLLYRL